MSLNSAQELYSFGQSVWYDNISRELIKNGELLRLVNEWGVRGVTSNPTIFDKAIKSTSLYDNQIRELNKSGLDPSRIFEELAVTDAIEVADLLHPLYVESQGSDGYVSIEVSPLLASNSRAMVEEAVRLHSKINRPNLMIKIPATPEGLPAVKAALERGINVNVTLIFSADVYRLVANTYCEALHARLSQGFPVSNVRSVASIFVSRIDSKVDALLDEIAKTPDQEKADAALSLQGRFGIANSKLAYQTYLDIFEGAAFQSLRLKGAVPQRPLWASTSTKNPAYRDVIYIEELIGNNTVTTIPPETLAAFIDHGRVGETLTTGFAEAQRIPQALSHLGIDTAKVFAELRDEGVKKFSESFVALSKTIASKAC